MSFKLTHAQKLAFNKKPIKEQVKTLVKLIDLVEPLISKQQDSNNKIKTQISIIPIYLFDIRLDLNSDKLFYAKSEFVSLLKDLAKGAVTYHNKYHNDLIDFYDIKPLFDKIEKLLSFGENDTYFQLFSIYVQEYHFEIFLNSVLSERQEIIEDIKEHIVSFFNTLPFSLTAEKVKTLYKILDGLTEHLNDPPSDIMLNILNRIVLKDVTLSVEIFIAFLRNKETVNELVKEWKHLNFFLVLVPFYNYAKNKKSPNVKKGLLKLFNSDLFQFIFECSEYNSVVTKNQVCELVHIASIHNVNLPPYLLKNYNISQLATRDLFSFAISFFHYGLNKNIPNQLADIMSQTLIYHYQGGYFIIPKIISHIHENIDIKDNESQILNKFFNFFNYNSICLFGLYTSDHLRTLNLMEYQPLLERIEERKEFYLNYEENKNKIKQIINNYFLIGKPMIFNIDYSLLFSLCVSRIKKKWKLTGVKTEQEERIVASIVEYHTWFQKVFGSLREYMETHDTIPQMHNFV